MRQFHGQQGIEAIALVGGQPTTAILDAHSPEHQVVTILLRAETLDRKPVPAGQTAAVVADLEVGTEAVGFSVSLDLLNGIALSVGGKRWRVSARNLGSVPMRVGAGIMPGVRPAARELQLTQSGGDIEIGRSQEFQVPAFAAWLEVYRADEDATEMKVSLGTPAVAETYSVVALQGERLPRIAIGNGSTRVTITNPERDKLLGVGDLPAVTPTLVWGLWL